MLNDTPTGTPKPGDWSLKWKWKSIGMFVLHFLCCLTFFVWFMFTLTPASHCSIKTTWKFKKILVCASYQSPSCSIPCVSFVHGTQLPGARVVSSSRPRGTSWSLAAAVFRQRVPTCEALGCRSKVAWAAVMVCKFQWGIATGLFSTTYILEIDADVVSWTRQDNLIASWCDESHHSPCSCETHHSVVSNICTNPYCLRDVESWGKGLLR